MLGNAWSHTADSNQARPMYHPIFLYKQVSQLAWVTGCFGIEIPVVVALSKAIQHDRFMSRPCGRLVRSEGKLLHNGSSRVLESNVFFCIRVTAASTNDPVGPFVVLRNNAAARSPY